MDKGYLGVKEQKAVLSSLSQVTAALLLGKSDSWLRKLELETALPPPRNADGTYDGSKLVAWYLDLERARLQVERDNPDWLLKMERVEALRLHNAMRKGELVRKEEVLHFTGVVTGWLKKTGHKLQRKFGIGAHDIMEQCVDGIVGEVTGRWGGEVPAKGSRGRRGAGTRGRQKGTSSKNETSSKKRPAKKRAASKKKARATPAAGVKTRRGRVGQGRTRA